MTPLYFHSFTATKHTFRFHFILRFNLSRNRWIHFYSKLIHWTVVTTHSKQYQNIYFLFYSLELFSLHSALLSRTFLTIGIHKLITTHQPCTLQKMSFISGCNIWRSLRNYQKFNKILRAYEVMQNEKPYVNKEVYGRIHTVRQR